MGAASRRSGGYGLTRVVLESPYAGDVAGNIAYARRALADSLARGEAPIAAHLLHTQVLDDEDLGTSARGASGPGCAGSRWRTWWRSTRIAG